MAKAKITIAPSIMAADPADLGSAARALTAAGAEWVHLDVMDGHFVPNFAFGPGTCAALRRHVGGVLDVHLMTAPASPWLLPFVAAGADVVTLHVEAGAHPAADLASLRAAGVKAGIAINPATPIDRLQPLMDAVDLICVLAVDPGFGGQSLIAGQVAKVAAIRAMIGARDIRLQVDGGVSLATAPLLAAAGADVLVAGGMILRGGPGQYGAAMQALLTACG